MMLADFGARVISVRRPDPQAFDPAVAMSRGKDIIGLDLRSPGGQETARQLAKSCDVLVEGFRPGVMERLGLGPDALLEINPGLVYARLTGWGQTGPYARRAGHDINYLAISGVLGVIGEAKPTAPPGLLGDLANGSYTLMIGILLALFERQRTGRGQVVDAAIVDGAAHLMTMIYSCYAAGVWSDERGTNLGDGGSPFYGVYQTLDAKFMAVGALEPQFYAEFLRLLELSDPNAQFDRDAWPQLRTKISAAFAARPQQEWAKIFSDSDACVAPVLGMADAPGHPQLAARRTFFVGNGITQPSPAPRFSRTPAVVDGPPCVPGQHTDEVLADWLN